MDRTRRRVRINVFLSSCYIILYKVCKHSIQKKKDDDDEEEEEDGNTTKRKVKEILR